MKRQRKHFKIKTKSVALIALTGLILTSTILWPACHPAIGGGPMACLSKPEGLDDGRQADRPAWGSLSSQSTVSASVPLDKTGSRPVEVRNSTPGSATFFNVGHGDSSLIQYQGTTVLVDTGKQEDHVAQKLLARGVRKIDYLVITHPHPDHVGGLKEIRQKLAVGKIIANQSCRGKFFAVIKPPRKYENVNDNSLVVVLYINNKVVVIPGDNEFRSQKELCQKLTLEREPVYLLKYPHHGVDDFPLFAKVKAEVVVISAGKDGCNRGIPQYTIEELQNDGSKVYWTARDGDVTIKL